MKYYDELKQTIIKMIQKNVDIPVLDSPIDKRRIDNKKFQFPLLLFKSYNTNNKKEISIIDYNKYDKFGVEEIPRIEVSLKGMTLCIREDKYKIVDYKNGVIILNTKVENLSEYNDVLIIDEGEDYNITNKEFILVSSPYNYNRTMNYNTVVNYRRFQINIFLYNDLDESKATYYTKKIHKIFERDFQILDKNGNKLNKQFAYIHEQLLFDTTEYNISNNIVSGSMLIRTYNR